MRIFGELVQAVKAPYRQKQRLALEARICFDCRKATCKGDCAERQDFERKRQQRRTSDK